MVIYVSIYLSTESNAVRALLNLSENPAPFSQARGARIYSDLCSEGLPTQLRRIKKSAKRAHSLASILTTGLTHEVVFPPIVCSVISKFAITG